MTTINSTAVGFVCGVYMAYIAGKKYGFYEGRNEAYREIEQIIDDYIENINKAFNAKNTATEGA